METIKPRMRTAWDFDSNEIIVNSYLAICLRADNAKAMEFIENSIEKFMGYNCAYNINLINDSDTRESIEAYVPEAVNEQLKELEILDPKGNSIGYATDFVDPDYRLHTYYHDDIDWLSKFYDSVEAC